jgi:hypothetical protein
VTSALDGAALEGVPVELDRADPAPGDLPSIARSDRHGRYTVKQSCDEGYYHLHAQHPGYLIWSNLSTQLWECKDQTITVDIAMVPCEELDHRVDCILQTTTVDVDG